MKRYRILMDVTETYEIFVDAEDEEEACDNAYCLPLDEIMSGDSKATGGLDIYDCEEVPYYKED